MAWLAALFALLINMVPVYGIYFLGWSGTTVLVLYWVENLLSIVPTALRIGLHRRWTRKRGHWRSGAGVGESSSLLGGYLIGATAFTLAHGVFVGAIVMILVKDHAQDPRWKISFVQLSQGVGWVSAFLLLDFLVGLVHLRQRSFAWISALVDQRMGRVIILHLAIIFGMMAMAYFESPFALIYVFVGLKTLLDLGGAFSAGKPALLPEKPPAWGTAIFRGLGKLRADGKETTLAEIWAERRAQESAQLREDEEVVPH
jgi:Family of unknown function (DUF6498)